MELNKKQLEMCETSKWDFSDLNPDSHFSFDSANHRVASDAFIYAGWKALKALRRSTPNG